MEKQPKFLIHDPRKPILNESHPVLPGISAIILPKIDKIDFGKLKFTFFNYKKLLNRFGKKRMGPFGGTSLSNEKKTIPFSPFATKLCMNE